MIETNIFTYITISSKLIHCKADYWSLPSKKKNIPSVGSFSSPPCLYLNENQNYILFDGHQQINTIYNKDKVQVTLIQKTLPICDIWLYRLAKRQSEANLSTIAFFAGLEKYLQSGGKLENQDIQDIARIIGIDLNKITPSLLDFINNPSPSLKQACDWEQVSYKELSLLASCQANELESFSKIAQGLKLKGNKLLQLLQPIIDLKKGYGTSFAEIEQQISFITKQEILSPSVKYKLLRNAIVKKRYPLLQEHLQTLEKLKQTMNLPKELECFWDPTLEQEKLVFSCSISKAQQLYELGKKLSSLCDSKEIQQMLSILE